MGNFKGWKKYLPLFVVLAIVVVVGVVAVVMQTLPLQPSRQSGEISLPPPPPSQPAPDQGVAATLPASTVIVSYNGSVYAPATIDIKKGDTVTFLNQGAGQMWPASAIHPTHAVYPTKGGCLGSTFDACRGLGAGESWSFTFTEAGRWGYHDHLNPNIRGTVVVK